VIATVLAERTACATGSPTVARQYCRPCRRPRSKSIKNADTGKRERFIRPGSEWQSLAERLGKAEAKRDALKLARTRASVAPLPSTIRAQVRALVTGLDVALRADNAAHGTRLARLPSLGRHVGLNASREPHGMAECMIYDAYTSRLSPSPLELPLGMSVFNHEVAAERHPCTGPPVGGA
jgi:hypothetical protein